MTLWTPGGERPVSKSDNTTSEAGDAQPQAEVPGTAGEPPMSPEEEEQARQMAKELADTRVRLMETEVATVLTNHGFGIYELAAIHLTADQPKLDETKLAIDALSSLVTGLEGRLGEGEATLKDALQQLQIGFVQRSAEAKNAPTTSDSTTSPESAMPEASTAGEEE